ncbi:sigma 54-interacting transcriptional regulator [Tistrella mobilis]|uniref:sigma-54 interaction domain-containing protein n=1 Tax=Tistrella mobilis TaxID=171437 RepID=UPI003558DAFB
MPMHLAPLRTAYFAGRLPEAALSALPEATARSWRRLRESGAGLRECFAPAEPGLTARMPELLVGALRRVGPKLRVISGDPEAAVCALFDPDGVLAAFEGGETALGRLAGFGWGPGIAFTEQQAGTNAVDLAIRDREPHVTTGDEHSCAALQGMSVYAFPLQAQDGGLFGCMALFTLAADGQSHARAVVSLASILMETVIGAEASRAQLSRKFAEQRAIADAIKDGTMVVDRDGVVEYMNAPAGRILRVDPEQAIGRRLADILGIEPVIAPIFATGIGYTDEEVRLKKGDVDLHLIDTAIPIKDGGGNVLSVVNTFREFRRVAQVAQKFGGNQAHYALDAVIGRSEPMIRALDLARRAAAGVSNVLITGESGTGKELFAQGIHLAGPRADRPFVAVNCAALPRDLIDSELFGYMPGSFTGANRSGRPGKFEIASGGTIFLDEISEMPLDVQAKLLRVLQEREIVRIGGSDPVAVDLRFVAAMNRDVRGLVARGRFREDLYYRLNVIEIAVPALRDRPGDIRLLARHYVERYAALLGRPVRGISEPMMRRLEAHRWPGNVRELQNTIERLVSFCETGIIEDTPIGDADHQGGEQPPVAAAGMAPAAGGLPTLAAAEKALIIRALQASGYNVTRTAECLGTTKPRLYRMIDRHGIRLERGR